MVEMVEMVARGETAAMAWVFRIRAKADGSFSSLIATRLFTRYCRVLLRDDFRITKDAIIALLLSRGVLKSAALFSPPETPGARRIFKQRTTPWIWFRRSRHRCDAARRL